jgi:DNA-binding response OmpR family regulator
MTAPPIALVVEDSAPLRSVLSAYLRQLGFEVTALASGDDAAEVARELRPQLICLDLMLPNVGGFEICDRLRQAEETAEIPVLITSARNTPQDRLQAELAGADDYIVKPVEPTAFAERVRRLMQRGQARA